MKRHYYSDAIGAFLEKSTDEILGGLVRGSNLDGATLERSQSDAWVEQIRILKAALAQHPHDGRVAHPFSWVCFICGIPQCGCRTLRVSKRACLLCWWRYQKRTSGFVNLQEHTSTERRTAWGYGCLTPHREAHPAKTMQSAAPAVWYCQLSQQTGNRRVRYPSTAAKEWGHPLPGRKPVNSPTFYNGKGRAARR